MLTILSPHLDDAVLSCWHLLAADGDVEVLNVFAGVPQAGTATPFWDAMTGAADPVSRMAERHAEDRAALALVERRARSLDLLDEQYRSGNGASSPPRVLERIREAVDPASVVYAPAGLGGYTDHDLVRDAGLALAADGFEVRLYADVPHGLRFGWPAWVTGVPDDPRVRPEEWWRQVMADAGLDIDALAGERHVLSDGELTRKREAVAAYRTQVPALERLWRPEELRYEVEWSLPGELR